jgi:hypothetical protein
MPLPTCLNETANALRRSGQRELAAALAVSEHLKVCSLNNFYSP